MSGYSAAKEVDRLSQGRTRNQTQERGQKRVCKASGRPADLPQNGVRNDAGKLLRLELDESKRRLWEDLATVCFLRGSGNSKYRECNCTSGFGHVGRNVQGNLYKTAIFLSSTP